MKDIFSTLDAQLSSIQQAESTKFDTEEEFLDAVQRLTKTALKENKELVEDNMNNVKKLKTARKLDFSTSSSTDKKLNQWTEKMFGDWGKTYNTTHNTYTFDIDELRHLDIEEVISEHDSYWCVDFIKATIGVVKEELTSFNYIAGKCERYIPADKHVKKYITSMWSLNPDNALDDQVIRLVEDIMSWMKEQECMGEKIGDTETYMKQELLDMDPDQIKDLFEWGDEDFIYYHILHFTDPDAARPIIRSVRLLLADGMTPGEMGLTAEDDWCKKIGEHLGLIDDEEPDWDEEMDELESKYNEDFYNELEKEREEKVEEERKSKISGSLKNTTRAAKPITIVDLSGKRYEFQSKGDCMSFLGTTSATFSKFLKGESKLNKRYTLVD